MRPLRAILDYLFYSAPCRHAGGSFSCFFFLFKMFNNREFVMKVIEKYKELPCLWQVTNKDYHNKHKRNAALDEILQIFKTKVPDANRETVQKKIASMRASFKKEVNKVQVSLRSGAEAGEVHVPKLWYYKHLLFLSDIETPRNSRNKTNDENEDDDTHTDELSNTEIHAVTIRAPSPSSSYVDDNERPPSESSSSSRELGSYKRSNAHARLVRPKKSKIKKEKYSAYGEHVAEKLRNMSKTMAIHCQKLMNDAIYMAELECLDMSSRIVTNSNMSKQEY